MVSGTDNRTTARLPARRRVCISTDKPVDTEGGGRHIPDGLRKKG